MGGSIVFSFLMTPFIVSKLGEKNYGLWSLIVSMIGYMSMLDFGIKSSINRYIAKYKSSNDFENINKIYSNALLIYMIIGAIVLLISIPIAINSNNFFNIATQDISVFKRVTLVMLIYTALQFPLTVFSSILYAYHKFKVLNTIAIIELIIKACGFLYLLNITNNLMLFCFVVVLAGAIKDFSYFAISYSIVSKLRFSLTLINKETLNLIAKYSTVSFIGIIAGYIIFKTDNIVIAVFLTAEDITYYSIGFLICDYLAQIIQKMNSTFTPFFSEYESNNNQSEIEKLIFASTRYSLFIGLFLGISAIAFGKSFISLWMGNIYLPAYPVLLCLVIARISGLANDGIYSYLYGVGKHHIILYVGVIEAITNISLSVILVKKIGILGVAIGTMVPMVIVNLIFPLYSLKTAKIKPLKWIKESVLKPTIVCLIYLPVAYIFNKFILIENWLTFFITSSTATFFYLAIFFLFGFDKKHKQKVFLILKTIINN